MAKIKGILLFIYWVIAFLGFVVPWYSMVSVLTYLRLTKQLKWYPQVAVPFFKYQFTLFGQKVEVFGRENMNRNHYYIVLCNHQSMLDIPLAVGFVRPVCFFAKKELFKIPLFGWALTTSGCLPVDRKNPRENKNLPQKMQDNIKAGVNYCVYPEGTRSADGSLLPFKSGIFHYIKDKPVPILPVTFRGSGEAMPKTGIKVFSKKIDVVIHPPIMPEEIETLNVAELKEKVYRQIKSAL